MPLRPARSEPAKSYSAFMPQIVRFHVDKWKLFLICSLLPGSLFATGDLELALLLSSGPHPPFPTISHMHGLGRMASELLRFRTSSSLSLWSDDRGGLEGDTICLMTSHSTCLQC